MLCGYVMIGLELGLKSLMLFAVLPSSLLVMVCEEQRHLGSSVWRVRQRPSQHEQHEPGLSDSEGPI